MARVLLILSVVIIIGSNAFSQTEISKVSNLFEKYYKDVQSLGVPSEANGAERRISDYLAQLARQHGFATQYQAIKNEHEYHSFASNLHIGIKGKSSKSIAIVIPLDAPESTNSGQSFDPFLTPTLACLLMDKLATQDLPISVSIEILGAENGESPGLGSRHFLETASLINYVGAIGLSIGSIPNNWEIIHGGGGKVSPAWLLDLSIQTLRSTQVPVIINTVDSQLYRLGVGNSGLITPYLQAGMPIVQFRSLGSNLRAQPGQFAEEFCSVLISLLTKNQAKFLDSTNNYNWDANYLVFNFDKPLIVPERVIALFFLASIIAYLFLIFLKRNDRSRYIKSFLVNIPLFGLIIGVSFSVFTLNTIFNWLFLPAYSIEPSYQVNMAWFFVGKILSGIALMMLITRLAWRVLPRQSSFYSAAAFTTSVMALLVVSTMSITISVYLMVCTLSISLANLSRPRWLKFGFFVFGAFCILQPVFESLRLHPGFEMDQLLLRQLFPGSILLTLLSLPFVFMWCRILLFIPLQHRLIKTFERWAIGLLFGVGCLIVVSLSVIVYINSSGFVDLKIYRIVSQTEKTDELQIKGANLLRSGKLSYGQQSFELKGGQGQQNFPLAYDVADLPSFSQTAQSFLGRKTMSVKIASTKPVHLLSGRFISDQELIVHSLNFPYRYINARSIQIFIGKNPPPQLTIELTLPLNTTGRLELTTLMPDSAQFIAEKGQIYNVPVSLSFQNRLEWK